MSVETSSNSGLATENDRHIQIAQSEDSMTKIWPIIGPEITFSETPNGNTPCAEHIQYIITLQ